MSTSSTIGPCIDCGWLTETVAGGSGRCGVCQYPYDTPPRPPSTPLRRHQSGRLVPACPRCRHGRPIVGDPLRMCVRCAYPDGAEPEDRRPTHIPLPRHVALLPEGARK